VAVSHFNRRSLDRNTIPGNVVLYDSTLRDGEQMPHVSFSKANKMAIATMLAQAGVKQIEAGFPAVSAEEKEIVKSIAGMGTGSEILALSRCCKPDIDAAVDSGVDLVMLFIASSDLHLEHKYRMTRTEVERKMTEALEYASSRGVRFSFSTEDSTRTEIDYILRLSRKAESLGACRIGLTDTVGCILPSALAGLVSQVVNEVNVPVSVHLHNDFGLALANALVSVEKGAQTVATTVNGIGERSGNVPLEQIVVAFEVMYGLDTGVDTTKLSALCRKVSELSGIPISPNAPWSGDNVFRHESGIHVAAMESDPRTYECVPPEMVGASRKNVLGKHSGRFSIRKKLDELGYEVSDEALEGILQAVKSSAQSGNIVDDDRFRILMEEYI